MLAIESAVTLPAGASPMEEYSRNYALRSDGKVVGIYVIPHNEDAASPEDYGCSVMLEGLGARPCTDAEEAELVSHETAMAEAFGQAGKSRWLEPDELPMVMDGGCDLVEVIFDPRSKQVESARCNGEV